MGKYFVLFAFISCAAYSDDGVQSFLSHADYLVFASGVSWKYSSRADKTPSQRSLLESQCSREIEKLKPALGTADSYIARYQAYEESRLAASPDDINTLELRDLVRQADASPNSPQLANRVRLKRLALFGRVETTLDELRALRARVAAHVARWTSTREALLKRDAGPVKQSPGILW